MPKNCSKCTKDMNGAFVATADNSFNCLECFAVDNIISPPYVATYPTAKPGDIWVPGLGFKTPNSAGPASGASKLDNTKADLSLIPLSALVAEAIALQVGEAKYGRYNYALGHKASQLVAATMRHLLAWFDGEEVDAVDGQSHLGAARANLAMLIEQQKLQTLKDNRRTKV